jgi:hypothetical protein
MPSAWPVSKIPILFRPVYTNSGSSTELLFTDYLPAYDKRSVDSIRLALAREYAVDLKAQARKIARDFKRCSPLPFFLPEPARKDGGRVFVPFKMRRPRITRDRVYGYADLTYIDRLEPDQRNCRLHLTTGAVVELLCSATTARANLALGNDIASCYLRSAPAEDDQIVQAARLLLHRLERIEGYLQQLAK